MDNPGTQYDYTGLTAERTLIVMLHDLRGPTNTISGLLEFLMNADDTLSDEERLSYFQMLQQSNERIKSILFTVAESEQVLKLREQ